MKRLLQAIGLSSLFLLSACEQKSASGDAGGAAAMPPAPVTAFSVTPRDVPITFEYSGQVAGSNEIDVHARVNGVIEKRFYTEGRRVEAGTVLFQLDSAPFKVILDQAEATLAAATAQKNSVDVALKKAQRDYARIAPLTQRALLSASQQDDAMSAVEAAEAAVQQASAAIQQAQAGVRAAKIDLGYTTIKAPITGVAGRAAKREGSLVQVGSDSLLTSVAQIDPAYIDFGMTENEHVQLRQAVAMGSLRVPDAGFSVALHTADATVLPPIGKLNFEDYKVDTQTGKIAMRATVENAQAHLLPGQFVRVVLQGAQRPQALVVPQRAVLDNPQGKYVYVIGNNEQGVAIAQPRPVEVGEWVKLGAELENAWVIKAGLKPGEQVIIEGTARIFFPGMPVQLAAAPPVPAQPAAKP